MIPRSIVKTLTECRAPASGSPTLEPHAKESVWLLLSNCLCPRKRGNLKRCGNERMYLAEVATKN